MCSVLYIYTVVFTFRLFIRTQISEGLFQTGLFDIERRGEGVVSGEILLIIGVVEEWLVR